MMLVRPSTKEVKSYSRKAPYEVIKADDSAHVVKDTPTGITAYIVYKVYSGDGTLVCSADAETIVMERTRDDQTIVMSICTPDLGITEKAYTTPQSSQVLHKKVVLNGTYALAEENPSVTLAVEGGRTVVTAACRHGQPVEFVLK
jgi:chondroitin-sulfate-ABC endolyase/exolyase